MHRVFGPALLVLAILVVPVVGVNLEMASASPPLTKGGGGISSHPMALSQDKIPLAPFIKGGIRYSRLSTIWLTPDAADLLTSENDDVADGNALLAEGKTAEALERYDAAARALPGRKAVHLNRGLALSRMGEETSDQALQAFQLASDGAGDDAVRARALFNLANGFYKKEDYAEAVKLYKQSLMLAPGNKDAAWNLELAKQRKKEKEEQEQQNKENQDQQNQDNQDEQNQQDQQNQDQQNQDKQNQEDKKDDQQQDKDKKDQQDQQDEPEQQEQPQDQQQEQQQPQPKTRQEVEQVLDSLDDQQKNLMKQMAKQKGAMLPAGRVKDW